MNHAGTFRHVRVFAEQDAADGKVFVRVDFDIHAAQRVNDGFDVFEIDQYTALDGDVQLTLQTGDDAVKAIVFVQQVDLGFVAAGIVDLAVAQNRGHDDAVVLAVQRYQNDGVGAGVVGHLLGIAVLAEHQIVLDLCVRFAECRSAHQRKKQSKQDGRKMLFHMFLRRGRFLILFI